MEVNAPHLVLVDLMLPGSDGIELMKGILDIARVQVMFLSAYVQEEVVAQAFDMWPPTTWSGPYRSWSWGRKSGRPCAGGRCPGPLKCRRPTWRATSPSTTSSAG